VTQAEVVQGRLARRRHGTPPFVNVTLACAAVVIGVAVTL